MTWLLIVLALVAFVLWGIPAVRFIASRLTLLLRLWRLALTGRAFVLFRSPLSPFSLHRGKKADVLVVCGNDTYLLKLGGAFKRATVITAHDKHTWRFATYTRVPSPSPMLMLSPASREVAVRFDIVSDASYLCKTAALTSCTPVYLLCPKPLSIGTADTDIPLSNGDVFLGMHLHTAKHFLAACRTAPQRTLTKDEKNRLRTAFRTICRNARHPDYG